MKRKRIMALVMAGVLLWGTVGFESYADPGQETEQQTSEQNETVQKPEDDEEANEPAGSAVQEASEPADDAGQEVQEPADSADAGEAAGAIEATEEESIRSLDEVPDIADNTAVEDQIIVLYEEPKSDNVRSLELHDAEIAEGESLGDTVDVLTPAAGVNVDEMIRELEQRPGVAAVSRNQMVETSALPNDPGITQGLAWQFEKVGAGEVWNQLGNGTAVKVAVIDTGVNINHEDLRGRCEIGYDYVAGSGSTMTDLGGHGSAVSGVIVSTANNGIGLAGIAGNAPVKVVAYRTGGLYENDKNLSVSYIVAALERVTARADIQVVNMSFGSGSSSSVLERAVRNASEAGKILVASSGNDGDTRYNYPASYDEVISVGATTSGDGIASFSVRNSKVDLCAPGADIFTTAHIDQYYRVINGTSFSSPAVAAAAAVVKSVNERLSADEVEQILIDTSQDLGTRGRDNTYGHGRIQLDEAVSAAREAMVEELTLTSFTTDLPSPQDDSQTIWLYAEANGGKGEIHYKFTATLNGETEILSDYDFTYSDRGRTSWYPSEEGTYTLRAYAKDESGQEVSTSMRYEIYLKEYAFTSFEVNLQSPQPAGTELALDARSELPDRHYYKFTATSLDNGAETVIQDWERDSYRGVIWTPDTPGKYKLTVYSRRNLTTDPSEDRYYIEASIEYEIKDPSFVSANIASPTIYKKYTYGSEVTLQAEVRGGTGAYEYKFAVRSGNGQETVIQDYSASDSVGWVPQELGEQTLVYYVRDSAGTEGTTSRTVTVDRPEIRITSFYSTREGPYIGENFRIWETAIGGYGELQYKTVAVSERETVVIQDWSTKDSPMWAPMKTGTYDVYFYARDELGTQEQAQIIINVRQPFADVNSGDWYYEYVESIYANRIMTGMDSEHFGPGDSLARAQFATILHRLNGTPTVGYTARFRDVAAGAWYTDAILWAADTNVVTGYSNGNFGPGDNINREQMALMMYRYANYKNYDTSKKADFTQYQDADRVSSFAREAMRWAVGNGIITGKYNETVLDPQGNASRAECATIITRFMNMYGG